VTRSYWRGDFAYGAGDAHVLPWYRVAVWPAVVMLFTALPGLPAFGQEASGSAGWLVTVGSYAIYAPRFEGANQSGGDARPIFDFRRADGREWLDHPKDGFGIELYETDTFRIGPVVDWRLLRHTTAGYNTYRTFGWIDLSVEGGLFAELWPTEWLRTRLELRHATVGGAGNVADFSADLVWKATPAMLFAFGPRLSFADSSYMNANYGSDTTGAGMRAVGLGAFGRFRLDEHWNTLAFAEWEHLTAVSAENAKSRHADWSNDGVTIGIGLSYTFNLKPWDRAE
jgi:outer membrane scaffolding protein for murein synthesis (MipA/OmpV family)